MRPSALELLFLYVESLRWKVEADHNPDDAAPLTPDDLEWHLQRNDDEEGGPRKAAYRLRLSLPPKENRFAYSFEIVLVGYFNLSDSVPEEQVARVLDANAPSLLYGAAREALATSVGRGPFRALLLPTVNFLELQRAPDAEEATTDKTIKALPRETAQKPKTTAKAKSAVKPPRASTRTIGK